MASRINRGGAKEQTGSTRSRKVTIERSPHGVTVKITRTNSANRYAPISKKEFERATVQDKR